MQTLKEVREQFYDDYLINRNNFYLSDEGRNIIDNLKGEDGTIYNKSTAAKIAYEFLDGIDATETENAFWESGYIRGYEVALTELMLKYKDTIQYDASYKAKQICDNLEYLLNN